MKNKQQEATCFVSSIVLALLLLALSFAPLIAAPDLEIPTASTTANTSPKATKRIMLRNTQKQGKQQRRQRQEQPKRRRLQEESIELFEERTAAGMMQQQQKDDHQKEQQQLPRTPRKSKIRIVNGKNADPIDRYPYFVSLVDRTYTHRCGGTLIAPDIVLTAAHCKA